MGNEGIFSIDLLIKTEYSIVFDSVGDTYYILSCCKYFIKMDCYLLESLLNHDGNNTGCLKKMYRHFKPK
jgi:hypothetical protein